MAANSRVNPALRILRLWRVHALLDFLWMTRDLKFFLICYISECFMTVASVTALLLLAQRFDGIGHWSKLQVVFMLGYATTVRAVSEMFFGYNVLFISRRLGRGQLDHTLIQPQPVWMTLLTEGFTPIQSSCLLLPGLVLMWWGAWGMHIELTSEWVGLMLLNGAASCAVLVSFSFLWGSLAFWVPRAAEEISSVAISFMDTLKLFPLGGVGPALLGVLMSVLPVGFVAWYPSRVLVGLDRSLWGWWVTPAAALVLGSVTLFVFNRGMKHYAEVGSQRYSGWGHRS